MEQTKARAVSRLNELNKITYQKPSARDLRGKRPMLQRVDRKAQRKYQESIESQKKKLKEEIKRIDSYLQSVRSRQEYIVRRMAYEARRRAYLSRSIPETGGLNPVQSVSLFTETPPVSPSIVQRPTVIVRPNPIKPRTRLLRYMQRRKFR